MMIADLKTPKWRESQMKFFLFVIFCNVVIGDEVKTFIYKAPCPLVLFFICPCVTLQIIVKNLPLKEQHLRKEKPKPKLLLAN